MIHVRRLDEWQPRTLAGTEGAWEPRFSPDGQWILFGTGAEPKKIPVTGGAPVALPSTGGWTGISWRSHGTIVLASLGAIHAINPDGGTPRLVLRRDSLSSAGVQDPFELPGGRAVAFRLTNATGPHLATVPLSGGEATIHDLAFANAVGHDDGWLYFGRPDGTIAAVELSTDGKRLGDRVVQVFEGAAYKSSGGVVASLSPAGTLAYIEGERGGRITFLQLDGSTASTIDQLRWFNDPQFSPDGRRVAVGITVGENREIWVLDIATNTLSRLAQGMRPAWTADGTRIVFVQETPRALSWIPADASGPAEQLASGDFSEAHATPDGQSMVVRLGRTSTTFDIALLPLQGDRTPIPLIATPASESMPRVSPDGRWLAYVSNESGEREVYVRPLRGGARTQISPRGGVQPVWAPDGKRIYFINNTVLYAAEVQASPTSLAVVRRDSLFAVNFRGNVQAHQTYEHQPRRPAIRRCRRAGVGSQAESDPELAGRGAAAAEAVAHAGPGGNGRRRWLQRRAPITALRAALSPARQAACPPAARSDRAPRVPCSPACSRCTASPRTALPPGARRAGRSPPASNRT